MSDFEFEEENSFQNNTPNNSPRSKPSALSAFMMKLTGGRVKTQKEAQLLMVAIILVCIIITAITLIIAPSNGEVPVDFDPVTMQPL